MSLLNEPLATVHTSAGTRIDFLGLVDDAGIFVTESGPIEADPVWAPLALAYPDDILAAYAALEPRAVAPSALIDAVDQVRRYTTQYPKSAKVRESDHQETAKQPSLSLPSVQVADTTWTGNGCRASTVDSFCENFPSWTVCHKNQLSDHWFQRVDNVAVMEKVCVFTSQFVRWRVRVRTWFDWSTLGDFTVDASTWRAVSAGGAFDFDYHSNVFNVVPDGYHRGATGSR